MMNITEHFFITVSIGEIIGLIVGGIIIMIVLITIGIAAISDYIDKRREKLKKENDAT